MPDHQNVSLPVEVLERRQLLSASVAAGAVLSAGGVLSVRGDRATANEITVQLSADGVQIETAVNSQTQSFAVADVKRVIVTGGNQNDTITVDLAGMTFNRSTAILGKDDVIWGCGGDDVIDAGAHASLSMRGDCELVAFAVRKKPRGIAVHAPCARYGIDTPLRGRYVIADGTQYQLGKDEHSPAKHTDGALRTRMS
jgi:hypothetical protein